MKKNTPLVEKIYFASDFHLGVDAHLTSVEREKEIVRWLTMVEQDATAVYLVGDIFDYWYEYKRVIPSGFSRFLGKIRSMRDAGIPIYFFTGNHDVWMFDYFQKEYGIPVFKTPQTFLMQGKKVFVGHGDGLGPGDHGYKFIKRIFTNPFCQWLFSKLHPNFALWLMKKFSYKSRESIDDDATFFGREKERLIVFSEEQCREEYHDMFIFGHRHLPMEISIADGSSVYHGLGDWTTYQSYGVLENEEFTLRYFNRPDKTIRK